uniref:Low affinity phosphate transporter n=1 Tax=Blastocladiella emersonii TaxID=4808 RepID=A0A238HJG1_BLAEM|nr:Low affinity phosphate transporter [Blastocladiella emersonii]
MKFSHQLRLNSVDALKSETHYAETTYHSRTGLSGLSSRLTSQNMSGPASPLLGPNSAARTDAEDVEHDYGADAEDTGLEDNTGAAHRPTSLAPPAFGGLPPQSPVLAPLVPLQTPLSPMRAGDPSMISPGGHSSPTSPRRGVSARGALRSNTGTAISGMGPSIWARRSMQGHRIRLGRRAIDVYVSLCDLRDYVQLNFTGFTKILKKFDKITGSSTRKAYLATVSQTYPFSLDTQSRLLERIEQIEQLYSHIMAFEDVETAVAELKSNLRQHVAFERNTVWRDMVSRERRHLAIEMNKPEDTGEPLLDTSVAGMRIVVPRPTMASVFLLVGVAIFIAILQNPIFESDEQQACFAILVAASWLWATEALPLFVTAMCIPLCVVTLRVLRDPVTLVRLDTHAATKAVFGSMFSPVIMLLLGGFSIAAALSKHHIAKSFAVSILARAGTRTIWVLLANMLVATFASMWISNVAAPVLCFSIIQPILRTLPPNSTFAPALILGIALASNIGGAASPISSPQSALAMENMKPAPSWVEWFIVSLPLCIVTNLITWVILLVVYQPHVNTPEIVPLRRTDDKLSTKQWAILAVTLLTIVLWCIESSIEAWVGDMGIIAIFPIVVFFGTGILTKDDFNNFLWSVIMLAMGGIALGKAVENSGLLAVIATSIKSFVHGMSLWGVLFTFSGLVLVVATFISHTVAALIVLPIVAEVGNQMADPHPRLLVMGAALMCSGAMGLPVSGFPNMNAISQEDATGKPYLRSWDFIKSGVPASIGFWLAVLTMGYGTTYFLGF